MGVTFIWGWVAVGGSTEPRTFVGYITTERAAPMRDMNERQHTRCHWLSLRQRPFIRLKQTSGCICGWDFTVNTAGQ